MCRFGAKGPVAEASVQIALTGERAPASVGPIPYDRTAQDSPQETWDRGYRARARRFPVFLATEALFLELWQPPIVTDDLMVEILGRIPSTRTPPAIPDAAVTRLLEHAKDAARHR